MMSSHVYALMGAPADLPALVLALLALLAGPGPAWADTPANCTYEEVRGAWTFHLGSEDNERTVNCTGSFEVKSLFHVTLQYPDVVVDEFGNVGFWTMIYNQGFEVVVHGRKFYANSKYVHDGSKVTSFCDQTLNGWSHDLLGRAWACYYGVKDAPLTPKPSILLEPVMEGVYVQDKDLIQRINEADLGWRAKAYPQFEGRSLEYMRSLTGGPYDPASPRAAPPTEEQLREAARLPEAWDWRNVDGQNYVTPVRSQSPCGSCYAFAATAMHEARLLIALNNSQQIVLSPQDVVDCSHYSEGCMGGFPYLIGGKYAEDYGFVEESCYPYAGKGVAQQCTTPPTCKRYYATDYHYVGGFYGACNEEAMKIALVNRGPLAVSFQVYQDFQTYTNGIYKHSGFSSRFEPFQEVNHAVTLVGYGVEHGVKFWTIKNSWGSWWGEQGYFRILRGVDLCAVESIALEATPIF